ncbi:MAG: GNAT family N-acetyltransferase, partial [Bdellovibrionia bacterium]
MSLEINSERELKVSAILSAASLRQFSSLLDLCFSVDEGSRFFDDFPIWDHSLKTERLMRFGIFHGDQLICSCAIRHAALGNLCADSLPVALIGAVATHPSWRGRGLASLLVNRALRWGEEQGAILAFLWGSEHSLYQRLGFELCGEQFRMPLRSLGLCDLTNSPDSGKISRNWVPELYDLVRARSGGLSLTNDDRLWFEAHKNVEWFYLTNENNLEAYAAYGRGIDLQGIVHEWGGDKASLRRILWQIYKTNPNAELLGPASAVTDFEIPKKSVISEYLCMAKILKPGLFFSAAYPGISAKFSSASGEWELIIGKRSLGFLTQNQLVKQCF